MYTVISESLQNEHISTRASITELPLTRTKERDDVPVFSVLDQSECDDLTEKFEQMKTTDSSEWCSDAEVQRHNISDRSVDACQNLKILQMPGITSGCYSQPTSYVNAQQPPDSYRGMMMFLNQAATASVTSGIAASVESLSVSLPTFVLEKERPGMEDVIPDVRLHSCFNQLESHLSKMMEKRRGKVYIRPYYILRGKHHSRRTFTIRRRRYGVSQKANNEPTVNELSTLMEKLDAGGASPKSARLNRKDISRHNHSLSKQCYAIQLEHCANSEPNLDKSRPLHHTDATLDMSHAANHDIVALGGNTRVEMHVRTHNPTCSRPPNQISQVTSGIGDLDMSKS